MMFAEARVRSSSYGVARSVYAFALLKLRRTRFAPPVSGVAAPRVARQGEAWRPGLDLNQD